MSIASRPGGGYEMTLFDGTKVRFDGAAWQWQNHDGSWHLALKDSVIDIAIEAELVVRDALRSGAGA